MYVIMRSIDLLALPGATEFDPTSSSSETDSARRVSTAMHGLLDNYIESDFRFTEHVKDNPMLYAHNVGRPALVGALRAQAGIIEGEEQESWRLLLNRFKRQEPAPVVMSYAVYLGSNRYMDNGLDVHVIGNQISAGNGLLADRQIESQPVNIAEVPGVTEAILKDLTEIGRQNNLELSV